MFKRLKFRPFIDWFTVRLIPEMEAYRKDIDEQTTEYGVRIAWICFGVSICVMSPIGEN